MTLASRQRRIAPGGLLGGRSADRGATLSRLFDTIGRRDPENGIRKLPPSLSYLICSAERTGSTLLGNALIGTGIAGRPRSYFNRVAHYNPRMLRVLGNATDDEGYLDRVIVAATTPNGVFGAKVHWGHFLNFIDRAERELRGFRCCGFRVGAGAPARAVSRPPLHLAHSQERGRPRHLALSRQEDQPSMAARLAMGYGRYRRGRGTRTSTSTKSTPWISLRERPRTPVGWNAFQAAHYFSPSS